jgi:hypothetical protein
MKKRRRGRALRRRYGHSVAADRKRRAERRQLGPAALNKQAREAFREGRSMYDVPEYVAEKRS